MYRQIERKAQVKVKTKSLRSINLLVFALLVVLAVFSANAQQLATPQDVLGRLFFNEEERNVMEAVRQGIVDPNVLRPEEQIFITPQLEIPEIVFNPRVRKVGNVITREEEISFTGLIRKHGGDTRIMVDDIFLDEEQIEILRQSLGLNFRTDRNDGGVIFVEDKLFKNNIALTRGDIIGRDGTVTRAIGESERFIVLKKGS